MTHPASKIVPLSLSVPSITSVTVRSSPGNPVRVGSPVTVTCAVELSAAVTETDLSLLTVNAQLTGGGNTPTSSGPTISGSTLTYSFSLGPFMRTGSDNYTCTATIGPTDPSFLTPALTDRQADTIAITIIQSRFNHSKLYSVLTIFHVTFSECDLPTDALSAFK